MSYFKTINIGKVLGVTSTLNSTIATLGIGGVFTGVGENVTDYKSIGINIIASHASAIDGLEIQFSSNNSDWDLIHYFTIPATTGKFFNLPVEAKWFRVKYTNGGTQQSSFRLQTVYHATTTQPSTLRLSDDVDGETAAVLNRVIIAGDVGGTTYRNVTLDDLTSALPTLDFPHHEIHEGDSFSCYYTRVTASTNGHRSGLYIKTPIAPAGCHMVAQFSASTAATYSICEAPTIAANIGTHANVIYNRYRDSTNTSGCFSNATIPVVNNFTTLTEVQIAADGTWATGTVIRSAPLSAGTGPKPAGGSTRESQEYILKANTAYVFLLTNTSADANTHHILVDWYEHTTT